MFPSILFWKLDKGEMRPGFGKFMPGAIASGPGGSPKGTDTAHTRVSEGAWVGLQGSLSG